ncbi:MAG: hypothetical protein HXX10_07400 [Rhodoplanes sp.]|uniref:hypothetical protein n=1 Tax=Rhodoplanes sp. TaxID=1968906 RepID=UPI00182994B6|nr:hypothetical protein [Rhodoplanes sp.]NVO13845.1 hypothetical protein [Rhodoplanes sp.]
MSPVAADIVIMSDGGLHPSEIASRMQVSLSYVQKVLKVHRPARPREPRAATTQVPARVLAMSSKKSASEIAGALGITRSYVYQILSGAR